MLNRSFRNGLLLILAALPLWGEVVLELSRNSISMDETVELYLRSEGRGMFSAPEIPMPDGLRVIGTSQRTQIVNGQAEFTLAYTLSPSRTGTFTIGPYRLQNGETLKGLSLTVTPATAVRATDGIFATLDASAESVLIRQTVELTLSIYSRELIGDINLVDFPEEGFEIGDWQEIRAQGRTLNGVRYSQKKFVARVTPTKAGTLVFDPVFRIEIPDRSSPRSMLFGPMSVRTERIQLQEPLVLEVSEPPEQGRPEGYTGHIGTFTLNAEVSPTAVTVGDPLTLRVALEGTGSLKQALPPHYETTAEFKVYQPQVVTEDLRRDGMSGRKVLEQVVIPTNPDIKELPELVFHYYHPETNSYRTLTAGPFPVKVTGNSVTSLTEGSMTVLKELSETELLGEDLIFLKSSPGRPRTVRSLTPGVTFGTGAGLPFLLWALSGLWLRQRQGRQADPARRRRSKASKRLQHRLRTLDDAGDLWAGIWQALSGTLQDRLNLPPGELSEQEVVSSLPSQMNEEIRRELLNWIRTCEQARFAGTGGQDPSTLREEIRAFLPRLDKELAK